MVWKKRFILQGSCNHITIHKQIKNVWFSVAVSLTFKLCTSSRNHQIKPTYINISRTVPNMITICVNESRLRVCLLIYIYRRVIRASSIPLSKIYTWYTSLNTCMYNSFICIIITLYNYNNNNNIFKCIAHNV